MHYYIRGIPQIYHTFWINFIPSKWVPFNAPCQTSLDLNHVKTNMTLKKNNIFNRKYIFIHGGFSSQSC